MTCHYCQNEIPNDSVFCPFCGNRIIELQINSEKNQSLQNSHKEIAVPDEPQVDEVTIKRAENKHSGGIWIILAIFAAIIMLYFTAIQQTSKPKTYSASNNGATTTSTSLAPRPSANPKPTSTPAPKLIPYLAKNGQYLIKPDYRRKCPLIVTVGNDADYYIYLKYIRAPDSTKESRKLRDSAKKPYQPNVALYVKAGQTAEINVPIGVYKLYYATGSVFYGTKDLFGDSTNCYSSNEYLEFYADSKYYQGVTLTLYKVANGNLETTSISESSFPTE